MFIGIALKVPFFLLSTELMSELEITKHTMEQQSNVILEKEREAVKRVQSAREEEWKKLHTIQDEK